MEAYFTPGIWQSTPRLFCDFKLFRFLGQLTFEPSIPVGHGLLSSQGTLLLLSLGSPLLELAGLQIQLSGGGTDNDTLGECQGLILGGIGVTVTSLLHRR